MSSIMDRSGVATGRAGETFWRRLQINRIPYFVYDVSPRIGKAIVQMWYRHITGFDPAQQMVFMNYGYAGLDDKSKLSLLEPDEANRYCIQLYQHLAEAVDLTGRDVLEIGCGRGGGSSYLARYLKPRSVTGMDIVPQAVEFCTRTHTAPGLTFTLGDADALPFPDNSFDAIVNVESSHYYKSVPGFLAEVKRSLRPGGHLLFADFRSRDRIAALQGHLENSGLEVVRKEDITASVFRALHHDSDRKRAIVQARVPWLFRKVFNEFASLSGTATYEAFRTRSWRYISYALRKPVAD